MAVDILQKKLNIYAVITSCPYLGSSVKQPFSFGVFKTLCYIVWDVLKQALGLAPQYIPAVALPGKVGGMTAPGSLAGLRSVTGEK